MKALITGITGQDGSYLTNFLLEKEQREGMIYGNISELPENPIANAIVAMKEEAKLKTGSILMNALNSLIKNNILVTGKRIR
ncbi:WblV protein [Photorhabdus laumondii subsp. laumondii TTO1]|uniref:WblV protein n=1 Tax=Photorhabdus laumondii subsp. laumondii (strain DSM 15139 / CIP 105565 / TT01) TaxID=243265 RepID=Q7MY67_PHOLL|nr:hypothetical protein A4R40_23980 [Photorhabdus laumondii subsp. laumondii]CAE17193.1 WblV protein [Photorhabdus laumondii subsp. laumondii TTO1]